MTRVTRASINLTALRHNLTMAKQAAPDTKHMAVIKANAYGHGMLPVAKALEQADALAVACVDEAVQLREAGINKPLTILEGFIDSQELAICRRYQLTPVVHQLEQISLLEAERAESLAIWLKIDTGMHRLGISPEQASQAWRRLQECRSVDASKIGLMSHLANADDRADGKTEQQYQVFDRVRHQFADSDTAPIASLANSAGILGWKQTHFDWVRPGIMLYGISPLLNHQGADHGLQPVMTLKSCLIAINTHKRGEAIGYGGSWSCPEDMSIGVVAIGYGDGYPRHAAAGTPVLINGQRATLIGRVSMDMMTVDLRGLQNIKLGDEVILWGEGLATEEVAQHAGTIAYDLVCGINPRVAVQY